jgi:hypothetical protein
MEEGVPPSPPPSLNGAMPDDGNGDNYGYDGYDAVPEDFQLPGEGQYDQAGDWHVGAVDERGDWQPAPSTDQVTAGTQFTCVRKCQAYSAFDPAEKGGKKTEKCKKGQVITAIETRQLVGKQGTVLRIHFEGGWVSQTAGNRVCFVQK